MRALTRSLGFVTDVARHVNALGWGIYATDHEDANGQFEQNFSYDDALVDAATARSSSATWSSRSRRSAG